MSSLKCGCRFVGLTSYDVTTPIGLLNLKSCDDGVHSLKFDESVENKVDDNTANSITVDFTKPNDIENANVPAVQTLNWLKSYFEDATQMKRDTLPKFCIFEDNDKGEESFTRQVWKRLLGTSPGETLTYSELADLCGNPKANRAVGQAMRTNPVVLMIPCHRVVPKNFPGVGNYSNGKSSIKEWLIRHEKSATTK